MDNNTRQLILERIKRNAPAYIEADEDINTFLPPLIDDMEKEGFVPLVIHCSDVESDLDFWRQMFLMVWGTLDAKMQEKHRQQLEMAKTIDRTSAIYTMLQSIFLPMKKFCFIFAQFDNFVNISQDIADLMKIRTLNQYAGVVTFSIEHVSALAERRFGDRYFSNQDY